MAWYFTRAAQFHASETRLEHSSATTRVNLHTDVNGGSLLRSCTNFSGSVMHETAHKTAHAEQ